MQVTSKELSLKLKEKGLYQGFDEDFSNSEHYFYWVKNEYGDGTIEYKVQYGFVDSFYDYDGRICYDDYVARAFRLDELIEECEKIDSEVWEKYVLSKSDIVPNNDNMLLDYLVPPKKKWAVYSKESLAFVGFDTPTEAVGKFLLWLIDHSKTSSSEKPNNSETNS